MLHKMLQTIDRYRMLEPQQRVVVGFSGGADSTALLFALHRLEQQLDIRVEACHINHCLRGEESERDQQFCTDRPFFFFCRLSFFKVYIAPPSVFRNLAANSVCPFKVLLCADKVPHSVSHKVQHRGIVHADG